MMNRFLTDSVSVSQGIHVKGGQILLFNSILLIDSRSRVKFLDNNTTGSSRESSRTMKVTGYEYFQSLLQTLIVKGFFSYTDVNVTE